MELFKVCEKDTKSKSLGKDGNSKDSKSDSRAAEREDKRIWLGECLEKLMDLKLNIDSDLEKLTSGRGRSKNKEQVYLLNIRI
jgi:CCR4-NOT transcription complex subunit 3